MFVSCTKEEEFIDEQLPNTRAMYFPYIAGSLAVPADDHAIQTYFLFDAPPFIDVRWYCNGGTVVSGIGTSAQIKFPTAGEATVFVDVRSPDVGHIAPFFVTVTKKVEPEKPKEPKYYEFSITMVSEYSNDFQVPLPWNINYFSRVNEPQDYTLTPNCDGYNIINGVYKATARGRKYPRYKPSTYEHIIESNISQYWPEHGYNGVKVIITLLPPNN